VWELVLVGWSAASRKMGMPFAIAVGRPWFGSVVEGSWVVLGGILIILPELVGRVGYQ